MKKAQIYDRLERSPIIAATDSSGRRAAGCGRRERSPTGTPP